jgi:hypothetical protein
MTTSDKWLIAKQDFESLETELVEYLRTKGAIPQGTVHGTIVFKTKNYVFQIQTGLLAVKET